MSSVLFDPATDRATNPATDWPTGANRTAEAGRSTPALRITVPVGRVIARLGTFLLPWAIAAVTLGIVVVLKGGPVYALLALAPLAVVHAVALLATWPVAVTVTADDVRVRRMLAPSRRFRIADVAGSVFAERLTGRVWNKFELLALGDAHGRSLLRVDDRLLTSGDLRTLAERIGSRTRAAHAVHRNADRIDDLVQVHPFAGTIFHRHPSATRVGGFCLALLGFMIAIATQL